MEQKGPTIFMKDQKRQSFYWTSKEEGGVELVDH